MIKPLVLSALLAGSVAYGAPAAYACPPQDLRLPCHRVAVSVAGSGTISPGLPCASSCAIHLDFTAVFAGGDVAATDCDFDGTGGADTLVAGAGGGTITCSDGLSGSVTFTRTLAAVAVGGTLNVDSVCYTITASLVFTPENVNPTTDFLLAGAGTLAETSCT